MFNKINRDYFRQIGMLLQSPAPAVANMAGGAAYPQIRGIVRFYQTQQGVVVAVHMVGLPTHEDRCQNRIFGFHIHEGNSCSGTVENPFADAGGHYNPSDCPHPFHAGDLPPLWDAGGEVFTAFLTNRFTVSEVVGKTLILHDMPDDFTTQPSGNSGARIACGVIQNR